MRIQTYLAALIALAISPAPAFAGGLGTGVGCAVTGYQGSLWMTIFKDGAKTFDFRIGAGGVIDEFRDAHGARLLAPAFPNYTDRVIGWVNFSTSGGKIGTLIKHGVVTGFPNYNVNQAGNKDGQPAPIAGVLADLDSCAVEIYSVPQDQWMSNLQSSMQGKYASLTRYEIVGNGDIKVRRVFFWGLLNSNGANFDGDVYDPLAKTFYGPIDHLADFYYDSWTPISTAFFQSTALALDSAGNLIKPQSLAAPRHQYFDATNPGYTVAFNSKNKTGTVLGIVYGKNPTVCHGSGCQVQSSILYRNFNDGTGVIDLNVFGYVSVGSYFDQSFILSPRQGLSAQFAQDLADKANALPPMHIYSPGAAAPSDINQFAYMLQTAYNYASSVRTRLLWPYVTPAKGL